MDHDTLAALLPEAILGGWGRRSGEVWPTDAGMTSTTVVVEVDGSRYVAKWVPADSGAALDRGSAWALRLASAGVATGEPAPTLSGELTFATHGGRVSLLRHVSGEPLVGRNVADQQLMAAALAGVHAVESRPCTSTPFMSDLLDLVHDVEPWIRPAVTAVLVEQAELPPLTWSILHADPAPDAFRYDRASGQVGLIDWTAAMSGPALYDLASAVMYLGGDRLATSFVAGYLEHRPELAAEVDAHLTSFSRLRGAVQAAYFSMRIATTDLTGLDDARGNEKGLGDRRRMLASLGVTT